MKDARTRRRTGRTRPHPGSAPGTPDERGPAHDREARGGTTATPTAPPRARPATEQPGRSGTPATEPDPTARPAARTAAPRPATRSGGRPRDAAREAEILAAAIDLVADEGLPGLTMDAVAARAGASKATLYRRWPDRLSLAAMLLDTLDGARGPLPDQGSARADLAAVLSATDDRLRGATGALLLGLASEARRDPALTAVLDRHLAAARGRIRAVLERGADRGELPGALDLDLVAAMATGMLLERAMLGASPFSAAQATFLADRFLATGS